MRFYKEIPPKICIICGSEFSRKSHMKASFYKKKRTCGQKCLGILMAKHLNENIEKYHKRRECNRCKKEFQPKNAVQRFCGSKIGRIGCSWINDVERRAMKSAQLRGYGKYKMWRNTTKIVV